MAVLLVWKQISRNRILTQAAGLSVPRVNQIRDRR
jgi:hypothetical protein